MHSDKNPRNLRFLVECKRLQQARRRLVAGVDARQKCMLLDASCVASTVVSSKVCLRFVACVIIYIYILIVFLGCVLKVASCGSVSARERSFRRGNAALYQAFGAASKTYFQSRSLRAEGAGL